MEELIEIECCKENGSVRKHFFIVNSISTLLEEASAKFSLSNGRLETLEGVPVETQNVLEILVLRKGVSCFRIKGSETPTTQVSEGIVTTAAETNSKEPAVQIDAVDSSAYYDVKDIIKKQRQGKQGLSGEELINRLQIAEKASIGDMHLLTKAVGTWLMFNCSQNRPHFPTCDEFEKMAKSVVKQFPSTSDFSNKEQPWACWHNKTTNRGMLEIYVRQKRSREGLSKKSGTPSAKRARLDPIVRSEEEIKASEEYMRKTVLNEQNLDEMLICLEKTRESRRIFIKEHKGSSTFILKKYPLFISSNKAIELEFQYLTGSNTSIENFASTWNLIEPRVIEHAKSLVEAKRTYEEMKNCLTSYEAATEEYDVSKTSFWLLNILILLLPDKRPRVKRDFHTVSSAIHQIIKQFETSTSIETALREAAEGDYGMGHFPGIVVIGTDFFIKVEEVAIPIKSANLIISLGYLTAIYFVLSLKYPARVSSIFLFFEKMFRISPSKHSVCVERLFANVGAES